MSDGEENRPRSDVGIRCPNETVMSIGASEDCSASGNANSSMPPCGTCRIGRLASAASSLTGATRMRRPPHLCATSGGVSTCTDRVSSFRARICSSAVRAKASVPQNKTSYGARGTLANVRAYIRARRTSGAERSMVEGAYKSSTHLDGIRAAAFSWTGR